MLRAVPGRETFRKQRDVVTIISDFKQKLFELGNLQDAFTYRVRSECGSTDDSRGENSELHFVCEKSKDILCVSLLTSRKKKK